MATMVLVTHSADVAAFARCRVEMLDGKITAIRQSQSLREKRA